MLIRSNALLPSSGSGIGLPTSIASTLFRTQEPISVENPPGCNFDTSAGPITRDGGLLVIDPPTLPKPTATIGSCGTPALWDRRAGTESIGAAGGLVRWRMN